jgi:hypothetical protein
VGSNADLTAGLGLYEQHKRAALVFFLCDGVHYMSDGINQPSIGFLVENQSFHLYGNGLLGQGVALRQGQLAGDDDFIILGPQTAGDEHRDGQCDQQSFHFHFQPAKLHLFLDLKARKSFIFSNNFLYFDDVF